MRRAKKLMVLIRESTLNKFIENKTQTTDENSKLVDTFVLINVE